MEISRLEGSGMILRLKRGDEDFEIGWGTMIWELKSGGGDFEIGMGWDDLGIEKGWWRFRDWKGVGWFGD